MCRGYSGHIAYGVALFTRSRGKEKKKEFVVTEDDPEESNGKITMNGDWGSMPIFSNSNIVAHWCSIWANRSEYLKFGLSWKILEICWRQIPGVMVIIQYIQEVTERLHPFFGPQIPLMICWKYRNCSPEKYRSVEFQKAEPSCYLFIFPEYQKHFTVGIAVKNSERRGRTWAAKSDGKNGKSATSWSS